MLNKSTWNLTPYQLLRSKAIETPNQICVVSNNNETSYHRLIQDVDLMASQINNIFSGNTKPSYIILILDPGLEFITLMFSCLKLGIPYIPLKVDYPQTFIEKIINTLPNSLTITSSNYQHEFSYIENLKVYSEIYNHKTKQDNLEDAANLNDTAYLIYTSGSTGEPKGVMISQVSLTNLIASTQSLYNINTKDRIILLHSLAFDFSVWEIISALLNGATLVIPESCAKLSVYEYFNMIEKYNISIINLTPSLFYLLIEETLERRAYEIEKINLRLIILGGEAVKFNKLKPWFNNIISEKANIFNMYGITEGTIHSTYLNITKEMCDIGKSFIGKPLAHVNISLQEITYQNSSAKELVLSGSSVAKGYVNNNNLTCQEFFINTAGEQSFFTGDLVEMDGECLVYIGRKDNLIKHKGFRVAIDDIANCLSNIESIDNVYVDIIGDGYKQIACFIASKNNDLDIVNILKKNLPDYMTPNHIRILSHFPINNNGKIDIKSLKALIVNGEEDSGKDKLTNIWLKVLNISNLREDINFFDAGGDSLLLLKLHFEIKKHIDNSIVLMDIIEHPSICELKKLFNRKGIYFNEQS
jgi:amino acid adenylation domain-containing protein